MKLHNLTRIIIFISYWKPAKERKTQPYLLFATFNMAKQLLVLVSSVFKLVSCKFQTLGPPGSKPQRRKKMALRSGLHGRIGILWTPPPATPPPLTIIANT